MTSAMPFRPHGACGIADPWPRCTHSMPGLLHWARRGSQARVPLSSPAKSLHWPSIHADSSVLQEPVDLALLLWGTSQHLHSSADAAACFRAVSRALVPGGLLFLEMLHPEDLFGGFLEEGDTW